MKSHVIVYILRLLLKDAVPWLRERAQETDSKIDDTMVDIIAALLNIPTK